MARTNIYFFIAIFCVLSLAGCTRKDSTYKESRVLMDTYCTITVVSPSRDLAKEVIDDAFEEIKKLEVLLNYFSDSSEITAINKAAGIMPVTVSSDTLEILNKTLSISKLSAGTFDPTLAPVIKTWNFSDRGDKKLIPAAETINSMLTLVDYKKISIDNKLSEIFLEEKGMELDLGGIAKGYAADKAIERIKAKGIKAALVAVAGDIRGFGLSRSGGAWRVGIQNPRPSNESDKPWEDVFATIELKDQAVSTSGDYQRYFFMEGKRYHHILDPKTGSPARSGLISVSVIAPEGYQTDSFATAVFVLGQEKGLKVLEKMGLDGVLVTDNKKVYVTEGVKGRVNIINEEYKLVKAGSQ